MTYKERIALYLLKKAIAMLPAPYEQMILADIIKESISDMKIADHGLVYIPPLKVLVDRDNNIYVEDHEGRDLVQLKVLSKKSSIKDTVWPIFDLESLDQE